MKRNTKIGIGVGTGLGLLAIFLLLKDRRGIVNWAGKTGWDTTVEGLGIRRNNPGNIKYAVVENGKQRILDSVLKYPGYLPPKEHPEKHQQFAIFRTFDHGCAAVLILMHKYIASGRNTVRKIVSRYAPPNENNTELYIKQVSGWLKVHEDAVLDVHSRAAMRGLSIAIIRKESGYRPDEHDWLGNHNFQKAWGFYQEWVNSQ